MIDLNSLLAIAPIFKNNDDGKCYGFRVLFTTGEALEIKDETSAEALRRQFYDDQ